MSAHGILNLLNELRKSHKIGILPWEELLLLSRFHS